MGTVNGIDRAIFKTVNLFQDDFRQEESGVAYLSVLGQVTPLLSGQLMPGRPLHAGAMKEALHALTHGSGDNDCGYVSLSVTRLFY